MKQAELMKLAREYACQAVEVYGEGDAREHDAAVLRTLWNDHPAVQSALLAIQATEARAQGLVDALTASALRFREYEASHAAKGNLDGDAKARRNCEMAEQCEQALATWRRT